MTNSAAACGLEIDCDIAIGRPGVAGESICTDGPIRVDNGDYSRSVTEYCWCATQLKLYALVVMFVAATKPALSIVARPE